MVDGNWYQYRVRLSYNGLIEEAWSAGVQMQNPCTPTSAPSLSVAALNSHTIRLTWGAGADALYYNIYRGGSYIGQTSGTQYDDGNRVSGVQYCYTVQAVSASGCTAMSNSSCATTPAAMPTSFAANMDYTSCGGSNARVNLSWNNAGRSELKTIWRRLYGASIWDKVAENVPAAATTHQDTTILSGLQFSQQYEYRINFNSETVYAETSVNTTCVE
jgi:hypothetical protein